MLAPPPESDTFEYAKNQLGGELTQKLAAAQLGGLAGVIAQGIGALQAQAAATATELSAKFAADGETAFELQYASLSSFYKGLDGVIGPATMHGDPPTVFKQLEVEHCDLEDSMVPFVTPVVGKRVPTVVPREQWLFVVEPHKATDDGTFSIPGRNNEALCVYKAKMGAVNDQLDAHGFAKMELTELIGARLYSGPMYAKYNGALRFFTGKESYSADEAKSMEMCPPFLQQQCERDYKLGKWTTDADGSVHWRWANRYATTIHAINSSIIKLSKLTLAQPVYRGMTGAALPKSFFNPNDAGLCGGIEFGFSST